MAKEINGAFWTNINVTPNLEVKEVTAQGVISVYKIFVIINYDLKNGGILPIGKAVREHFSDASETMRTVAQVTEWINTDLQVKIANDKLELAGYGE